MAFFLPIGGLYATYHLLGEPETTVDLEQIFYVNHLQVSQPSVFASPSGNPSTSGGDISGRKMWETANKKTKEKHGKTNEEIRIVFDNTGSFFRRLKIRGGQDFKKGEHNKCGKKMVWKVEVMGGGSWRIILPGRMPVYVVKSYNPIKTGLTNNDHHGYFHYVSKLRLGGF